MIKCSSKITPSFQTKRIESSLKSTGYSSRSQASHGAIYSRYPVSSHSTLEIIPHSSPFLCHLFNMRNCPCKTQTLPLAVRSAQGSQSVEDAPSPLAQS